MRGGEGGVPANTFYRPRLTLFVVVCHRGFAKHFKDGSTPLFVASAKGNLKAVRHLIAQKADPDQAAQVFAQVHAGDL